MAKNDTNKHSDSFFPAKTGAAANDWKGWVGFEQVNVSGRTLVVLTGHCVWMHYSQSGIWDSWIGYDGERVNREHGMMRAGPIIQNEALSAGFTAPVGVGMMQTVPGWGNADAGDMLFLPTSVGPETVQRGYLVTAARIVNTNSTIGKDTAWRAAFAIAAQTYAGGDIDGRKAFLLPWLV